MRVSAVTLGVVLALAGTGGSHPRLAAQPAAGSERPRLVVLISVDQFRRDYIQRYGARWTGGLARLIKEGAVFEAAAYPYFHTITCAGHATMATGVYPATHGLPLNAWWDREKGRDTPCTDDGGAKAIGHKVGPRAPTGGHSAHLLRAPTLADVLRQQVSPTPRVVSMSMKPRAAIMLAGQAGDAVLWYSADGGPTTSTAYASKPIDFVADFARKNPTPGELSGDWTRMLPVKDYQHEDAGPGEDAPDGWTTEFPHPLTQTRTDGRVVSYWQSTPAADAYLGRLAATAVDELKLGSRGLDYLGISFSTLDSVGHGFGPDSHEVQDTLLRLDKTLGELLAHLDAKVGKGRYVVAVTGDHGVAPLPERRRDQREDGGRVNLKALAIEIEAALSARWGKATYLSKVAYTDVYFVPGVYARLEKDAAAMADVVAIIERTPGLQHAYRREQITAAPRPEDDAELKALRLSLVPDRSGDLILVPKPYWIMIPGEGTTHGSPQAYDRDVPVILFGAGIKPGRYAGAASPADIVPTLAALAHVRMPKTDGRVLQEALSTPSATTP
jgi:predicted AlkP superfamily pyrophosphatase or phosphodiesterase